MSFFRSRIAISILAGFLTLSGSSQAAVSYLMIQGDFGMGIESHKWRVEYDAGALQSGQDLMNAVFGVPEPDGTIVTSFGTYPYSSATQSATGHSIGYIVFDFGLYLNDVTINGSTVSGLDETGWVYHLAGGDGTIGGPYDDGDWIYAGDGLATRALADGSFDSFIFGTFDGPDIVGGSGVNSPSSANFQGIPVTSYSGSTVGGDFTVYYYGPANIPEPGKGVLLMLAGLVFVLRRKR